MKKLVFTIMVFFCLASSASAVIPVIAWVASAVIHTGTVAGIVWYNSSLRSGTRSVKNTNVGVPAEVQWLDLTGPTPILNTASVTAKLPKSEIQGTAISNATRYPILRSMAINLSYFGTEIPNDGTWTTPSPTMPSNVPVGQNVKFQDGYGTVTSAVHSHSANYSATQFKKVGTTQFFVYGDKDIGRANYWNSITEYSYVPATPTEVAANPEQFDAALQSNTVPQTLDESIIDEIDDMLQAKGGSVSYVNSSNSADVDSAAAFGSPTAPTSAQVAAAATSGAAATVVDKSTKTVTTAQAVFNNASSLYGKDSPQALAAAAGLSAAELTAANAAQIAAENLAAEVAKSEAEAAINAVGSPAYDGSVVNPDSKGIAALLTSYVSNSPLAAMVRTFTISTADASPIVSCGMVYGQEFKFDFSRWASFLQTCGAVLLVIAHGFAVLVVLRGW